MAFTIYGKNITDLPIYCEQAAEIVLTDHKMLTENSIVITASKSGTTKETVAMAKWCKEKGIRVVSLIGVEESPLHEYSTYALPNPALNGVEFEYMQLMYLLFKLLNLRGDFPRYEDFANQLELLPGNLIAAKEKFEPIADKIAKTHYKEPIQYWIGGGGTLWGGEVYLITMCILEEMQWIKTRPVRSSEFFFMVL